MFSRTFVLPEVIFFVQCQVLDPSLTTVKLEENKEWFSKKKRVTPHPEITKKETRNESPPIYYNVINDNLKRSMLDNQR